MWLCGGHWVCARSLLSCYTVSQKSSDGKLWFYATHEKDKKSVLQITCSIFRDRIQNNVDVTRTTAVRRPIRKTRHRIIVFFLFTAFTRVWGIECILLCIAHETENHFVTNPLKWHPRYFLPRVVACFQDYWFIPYNHKLITVSL